MGSFNLQSLEHCEPLRATMIKLHVLLTGCLVLASLMEFSESKCTNFGCCWCGQGTGYAYQRGDGSGYAPTCNSGTTCECVPKMIYEGLCIVNSNDPNKPYGSGNPNAANEMFYPAAAASAPVSQKFRPTSGK